MKAGFEEIRQIAAKCGAKRAVVNQRRTKCKTRWVLRKIMWLARQGKTRTVVWDSGVRKELVDLGFWESSRETGAGDKSWTEYSIHWE